MTKSELEFCLETLKKFGEPEFYWSHNKWIGNKFLITKLSSYINFRINRESDTDLYINGYIKELEEQLVIFLYKKYGNILGKIERNFNHNYDFYCLKCTFLTKVPSLSELAFINLFLVDYNENVPNSD